MEDLKPSVQKTGGSAGTAHRLEKILGRPPMIKHFLRKKHSRQPPSTGATIDGLMFGTIRI
jgi:hypothetical protein